MEWTGPGECKVPFFCVFLNTYIIFEKYIISQRHIHEIEADKTRGGNGKKRGSAYHIFLTWYDSV
jgi:hypothetical protein